MNLPDPKQWQRIEELGEELGRLPSAQATFRVSQLAAEGESATVLTMLANWVALPPPAAPIDVGGTVGGRYTLREKIGEGGMGSVWRARQEMVGRDVALKIIHPALVTPDLQRRFLTEIELLGHLDHPGIVKIFDAGMHEQAGGPSIPFFTMELIDGQSLKEWAAEHRHDRAQVLKLSAAICAAVQAAHEQRIVHRDLKPTNILVRKHGQPVVLDFGIARLAGIVIGEESGLFSGTPRFAAPEQHLCRDHDFRSGEGVDIYAAGAIIFEILSGEKLFDFPHEVTLSEMRRAVLEDPVPRLAEVMEDCPAFLDEIVSRAVRRNPADRFYSMAALRRAIERAAAHITPSESERPPWRPAAAAIVPGTNWMLVEKIGEGAAGEVWTGRHDQLGERRVFKFCDTEDKARTLKRELTLFRLLKERVGRNPHFIQLHEVSLDEPPWYLMMDYTEALDLGLWCAAQTGGMEAIPEEVRVEIVAQAAEALQAAHQAGILHRDIKPANLLVRADGASGDLHILVADFGIGQIVSEELLRSGTRLGFTRTVRDLQTHDLSGTILYLAPEVLEGHAATARSDIYSLGVVFWQLLIGNLHLAVDTANWAERIHDPLLRDDLKRCLAGSPDERWASAGELAASLRALPERRDAERRRRAELAMRERTAYWNGVVRTAAAAAVVIAIVAGLAWFAWTQRQRAERARGEIALEHVLKQADFSLGRRERGMDLLNTAAATVKNRAALRTAAAVVFGMLDLVRLPAPDDLPAEPARTAVPAAADETCRALSHDGSVLALGRDLDGVNGAVDLFDSATGKRSATVTRQEFPWVPIAQTGMLRFSPDDKLVAVGGAATSRQILLFQVPDGALRAYIFQGTDPLSCAWHPGGRLFATGCADGTVRIWDIAAATPARLRGSGESYDLPPSLDIPALDVPVHILRGYRGPVVQLAFSQDGRWLASLDSAGYLRVHTGFSRDGLPELPPPELARQTGPGLDVPDPAVAVEVVLPNPEGVTALTTEEADRLLVQRAHAPPDVFRLLPGELPAELHVAPAVTDVAWSADGKELCAITFTDIYWLRARPLEVLYAAMGKNPKGVSGKTTNGFWALPEYHKFLEYAPVLKDGAWSLRNGAAAELKEAKEGQGARTSMAASGDSRIAVYYGRRIQFFANGQPAPLDKSIVVNGGDGVFRKLLWDQPGRLLGAVFEQPDGQMRLETWQTSHHFPPVCKPLPMAVLDCQRLTPANDGRHFLARGRHAGIVEFDPATATARTIDLSGAACQGAPLAATADGSWLAIVSDRRTVRLLTLPDGHWFADLHAPRQAALTALAWDDSGRRLASLTEDGYVQLWNLSLWQAWLASHDLAQ